MNSNKNSFIKKFHLERHSSSIRKKLVKGPTDYEPRQSIMGRGCVRPI